MVHWKIPVSTIVVAVIVAACGGGGAATDATEAQQPPVEETPGPGAEQPAAAVVTTPNETFAPRVVSIAPGASVTWQFSGSRHNVTFGSRQPSGGSIPDTEPGGSASRVFANAGTYDYQCTRHNGMTGQVVVGGTSSTPTEPPPGNGTLVVVTSSGYNPERAEITPGGTITWELTAGADGIVFEDDSPPGGNIPQTAQGGTVSRTFPSEGDYDYYSLKDPDTKGRVRVR